VYYTSSGAETAANISTGPVDWEEYSAPGRVERWSATPTQPIRDRLMVMLAAVGDAAGCPVSDTEQDSETLSLRARPRCRRDHFGPGGLAAAAPGSRAWQAITTGRRPCPTVPEAVAAGRRPRSTAWLRRGDCRSRHGEPDRPSTRQLRGSPRRPICRARASYEQAGAGGCNSIDHDGSRTRL
jgi:hypothetical protein